MYFNTDAYAKLYPRTETKAKVKTEELAVEEEEEENEEVIEEEEVDETGEEEA